MKDDTNVFWLGLKTQTNLFLVTSRSFCYKKKKKKEIVAELNLDLLCWNLVEFTAIHSCRRKRRVSSMASQIIIAHLQAEVLLGLLGLHSVWGLMCQSQLKPAILEEGEQDWWCCSCLCNACLVAGSAVRCRRPWGGWGMLLRGTCFETTLIFPLEKVLC